MARIRSLHATQWNDDDFIECSPFARLLALALRNFTDDQGVFEWKPSQIKRSCLPGDACDVKPLLRELIDHNQVRPFTVDGKDYGAIRNFGRWQRPKSPNSTYPLPAEFRKYVALRGADFGNGVASAPPISEMDDDEPVPISEKSIAEVGGRRLEVGDKKKVSVVPTSRPPKNALNGHKADFTEFYSAFPRHVAPRAAEKAYAKALSRASPETILAGAKRYATAQAREEPKFIQHPATWLNADRWMDEEGKTLTPLDPLKAAEVQDRADQLMRRGKYAEGNA